MLINSLDAVANMTNPKTINNVQILACCITTIPIKLIGDVLLLPYVYWK